MRIVLVSVLAAIVAHAQEAPHPRVPNVAWPIFQVRAVAERRAFELAYYADGRFRVRAAAMRPDSIGALSAWQEVKDESTIRAEWVLAHFKERRAAIVARIADATRADGGAAATAAADALAADDAPLFVVHLLAAAAAAEPAGSAPRAAMEALSTRIERAEAAAYRAAAAELAIVARAWVEGRLEGQIAGAMARGPDASPVRLDLVRVGEERIGVIALRDGTLSLVHGDGRALEARQWSAAQLRRALPAVYRAWMGADEPPPPRGE